MVKYFKPYIDKKEERAVIKVLRSGHLTTGPKVQQLEEMYKELTGRRYAVSLSSATSALFLTAKVLFPKDKKICSYYSTYFCFYSRKYFTCWIYSML